MKNRIIEDPRVSDAEEILAELRNLAELSHHVSRLSMQKLSSVSVERPRPDEQIAHSERTMSPLFADFRNAIGNTREHLCMIKEKLENAELPLLDD